jgi:hypothetical protein
MKKKKLYNKTYDKTILVVYGCDNKSFCRFIKKNYKEDIDIANAKGCFYDKNSKMVIWAGEENKLDMSIFVHELCHACFYLLRYVSIPARKENDEAFAYLFESFYSQIK